MVGAAKDHVSMLSACRASMYIHAVCVSTACTCSVLQNGMHDYPNCNLHHGSGMRIST